MFYVWVFSHLPVFDVTYVWRFATRNRPTVLQRYQRRANYQMNMFLYEI